MGFYLSSVSSSWEKTTFLALFSSVLVFFFFKKRPKASHENSEEKEALEAMEKQCDAEAERKVQRFEVGVVLGVLIGGFLEFSLRVY